MDIRYIVQATNDIFRTLSRKLEPTAQDLSDAFAVGCNALRRLADDRDFINDLMTASTYQHDNATAFKAAVDDVDHFVGGFLMAEKGLLLKAGLSKKAVETLIEQAKALRDDVKGWEANPEKMRVDINKFRNEVCHTAEALLSEVLEEEERKRRRLFLVKVGRVLGGIAFVGINTSLLAIAEGISQVGIAMSGALGSAMMAAAMANKNG